VERWFYKQEIVRLSNMIVYEIVSGIISLLIGLLIMVYRKNLTKMPGTRTIIDRPKKVFGLGRTFEERYGSDNAPKWVFAFGLIIALVGLMILIFGLLGINIINK